jgi:hypothetical protein
MGGGKETRDILSPIFRSCSLPHSLKCVAFLLFADQT